MFECGLFHDENGYLCKSECWSLARLKMAIRYDHARIQEFLLGREGGCVRLIRHKKALTMFFFFHSLVLNLYYRIPVVTFKENYHLPRFQWGWTIFLGSNFFRMGGGGGVELLVPYRNPYNLWFSGVRTPCLPHPLWIRPCDSAHRGLIYLLVFLFSFSI